MKVYSPSEIANVLELRPATLRKYSIMLEERGYNIPRNSQNHRYYSDEDIITLRRVLEGTNDGATLDKSITNVLDISNSQKLDNTYTNDTNNGVIPYDSDISELKETVHKQTELIKKLSNRLDKQEERANERDQALMQAINESIRTQKQIAASEQKKGFFARLFNRNR